MGGPLKNRPTNARLLAVGLLVLCVTLFGTLIVWPLLQMNAEYAESIDELNFRLAKFRKIAAEKDAWLARLDELKNANTEEERFLARDTAALASADMQTKIKQAVTDAGGELISTQVIPERKEEQFNRIAVKVRMTGNTESLRDILHAFESANPLLFIENLNVRPIRIGQPVMPGQKPPKVIDKLSVDFDVVGYMRAGAA